MKSTDWQDEYPALVRILEDRLGSRETCSDLIDDYQEVMASVWTTVALFLGHAGTGAIVSRSIQMTSRDRPLLRWISVGNGAVDFDGFRDHVPESCSPADLLDAFLYLGVMIFQILSELSGDSVTGSLLSQLE